MIQIRKAAERGQFDHGWLKSAHTFSFADYHDPRFVQFRSLRVINEDHVAGGSGFGMHPHRDMEILTWILAGALRHEDDMGHREVIRPGDVQIMSAGTGVMHSEQNDSATTPVHLLQIWIHPDRRGLPPRYDQKAVDRTAMAGSLLTIAAPPGETAVVPIHQDVRIHATNLQRGEKVVLPIRQGRSIWIQIALGEITVNDTLLVAGDGAAIRAVPELVLEGAGADRAEALVFDLA